MKKFLVFFTLGAVGYTLIELLFRGYTHPTMAFAGGLSLVVISLISERLSAKPLILRAGLSALAITAIELLFGIVFNLLLGMRVWDYSNQPFNLLGQICPSFTLAWFALSLPALPITAAINRRLANHKPN